MSTDKFVLVISVAVAVRRAHRAGLIDRWLAEGLAGHGGNTATLLLLCKRCRSEATSAGGRGDEARACECALIADGLDRLVAEILETGDRAGVATGATSHARPLTR